MTDSLSLSSESLDQLFGKARSFNAWQKKDVPDALLEEIYHLVKMAPSSANCSPARFVFVTTPEGKEKLKPALSEGNLAKTMSAPLTVIIAHDMQFFDHLPELFPHTDARAWFTGNDAIISETAIRNGTLQGAYFMLAARALGLDCGPMSGFDVDMVNTTFFPDGRFRVNFLCNIGYGDDKEIFPRLPRFNFEQACTIV